MIQEFVLALFTNEFHTLWNSFPLDRTTVMLVCPELDSVEGVSLCRPLNRSKFLSSAYKSHSLLERISSY